MGTCYWCGEQTDPDTERQTEVGTECPACAKRRPAPNPDDAPATVAIPHPYTAEDIDRCYGRTEGSMAKTYEVVVFDDGADVTSAITEYDRVDGGLLVYVGRTWLDADETSAVLDVITDPTLRAHLASLDRMVRASDHIMAEAGRAG